VRLSALCLGHARRDQHGLPAAPIRPTFQADSAEQARDRLSEAIAHLDGKLPKVAAPLEEAEEGPLAFYSFPPAHWSKLRSMNPLERFNKEIGRSTDAVGIFPDDRLLIRLVGMLCLEQNDCHEGRPRRASGLSSPRRTLGARPTTASTRGGRRAVSRYRLGHPPRRVVRAERGRRAERGG
jgi:transposase-like protein